MVFSLVVAAARATSLRIPIGADTGSYLYVGGLLLHGGTPYLDALDNKGPVNYLWFGLVQLVAGQSSLGVRLCMVAVTGAAAVTVGAYARRLAGAASGAAAGLVFATVGAWAWQGCRCEY